MKIKKLNLFFIYLMLHIASEILAADNVPAQTQSIVDPNTTLVISIYPIITSETPLAILKCHYVTIGKLLIPIVSAQQKLAINTQSDLDQIRTEHMQQLNLQLTPAERDYIESPEMAALRATYLIMPDERKSPTQK